MIIIGWLAAAAALSCLKGFLNLSWNFFDWSPKWNAEVLLCNVGLLAVLVGFWFLARETHDRTGQVISALICLALAGHAVLYVLPAEPLSHGWLGRRMSSPLWYRGGISLIFMLPGMFWLRWVWKRSVDGTSNGPVVHGV